MSKKSVSQRDMKILWGRSGNTCAICKTGLIQERNEGSKYPLGEMAHIEGKNPGSARYNPTMTDDEKSTYHNLILVCPRCHGIIDNDCQEYTVKKLEQIKNDHEKWVFESLRIHMPEVDFAELKTIINHLSHVPITGDVYSIPIPAKEKIEKSRLSPQVENLIKHGMVQLNQVKNYLDKNADRQFIQRLREGFVNRYRDLRNGGLEGDALFYELLDFASNNSSDITAKAAGMYLIAYFFEQCEVFER